MLTYLPRLKPSSGPRLPGIEGLRAVAAMSILGYHAWLYSNPDGYPIGRDTVVAPLFESMALGVVLFFALSGFLLYRPFVAAAFDPGRRLSVGAYFRNRALRILPAYWVILAIAGLILQSTNVRNGGGLAVGALSDPGDFVSAALLVHDYRPGGVVIGIGPAWSLAVEVVFYLLLPLLGSLALALASRARRLPDAVAGVLVPAALMLLVGLSGKLAAAELVPGGGPAQGFNADWHSVVVRSFWAQADLFAFGMAVAVLHVLAANGTLKLPRGWRALTVAVAFPVGALAAIRLGETDGHLSYTPENTLVAAVFAALLALVVLPRPDARDSRLLAVLEVRLGVYLGVISYSLFLWHEPVVRWLEAHDLTLGGPGGLLVNIIVLTFVAGVLSLLTYRLVETPALRHKAPMKEPTQGRHRPGAPSGPPVPPGNPVDS